MIDLLEKPVEASTGDKDLVHLFDRSMAYNGESSKLALCGANVALPQAGMKPTCETCLFKAKQGWGAYYDAPTDKDIPL